MVDWREYSVRALRSIIRGDHRMAMASNDVNMEGRISPNIHPGMGRNMYKRCFWIGKKSSRWTKRTQRICGCGRCIFELTTRYIFHNPHFRISLSISRLLQLNTRNYSIGYTRITVMQLLSSNTAIFGKSHSDCLIITM